MLEDNSGWQGGSPKDYVDSRNYLHLLGSAINVLGRTYNAIRYSKTYVLKSRDAHILEIAQKIIPQYASDTLPDCCLRLIQAAFFQASLCSLSFNQRPNLDYGTIKQCLWHAVGALGDLLKQFEDERTGLEYVV